MSKGYSVHRVDSIWVETKGKESKLVSVTHTKPMSLRSRTGTCAPRI